MSKPVLRHAFTLIELLVVVAVIALLIGLLLPSLARAREQARIAVCLANLRTIGQAAHLYMDEFKDLPFAFPHAYSAGGENYSFQFKTPFTWGGGQPDKSAADWQRAGVPEMSPSGMDTGKLPARHRPLNRYIASSVSWDREKRSNPADIPGFFRCPSDWTCATAVWLGDCNLEFFRTVDEDGPNTTWSFWGSSYPLNWYWSLYYLRVPPNGGGTWYYNSCQLLGAEPDYRGVGKHMFRKNDTSRWAAEFVLFTESRLSLALAGARAPGWTSGWGDWGMDVPEPRSLKGWHKQQDRHSAAFLDGHAEHRRFDTRYVWGTGWTIWPQKLWQGYWEPYNKRVPE